jgi:chromosome partitioning protein
MDAPAAVDAAPEHAAPEHKAPPSPEPAGGAPAAVPAPSPLETLPASPTPDDPGGTAGDQPGGPVAPFEGLAPPAGEEGPQLPAVGETGRAPAPGPFGLDDGAPHRSDPPPAPGSAPPAAGTPDHIERDGLPGAEVDSSVADVSAVGTDGPVVDVPPVSAEHPVDEHAGADPTLRALVAELDPTSAPSSPAWAPSPPIDDVPPTATALAPPAVAPVVDVPVAPTEVESPVSALAPDDGTVPVLPPPVPAPPTVARPDPARFARPFPRVVAIANQKGGVGKTTTAVNLSAGLAEAGYRVLVIDLDPQGNASTGLGINIRDLQSTMYDVLLRDVPLDDCIEATDVRNLFVAPANLDLAGAEIELVPAFSRELKLRRALEAVVDDYDFVFIDCPPSLGLLTVNSLAAASEVLVPIQCEYYALEGLGQLMRNVGLVQKNLNPDLELSVIVCVMYDARTKLAEQVVREVRSHFGDTVCRTVVPRTVRLSEAPSFGQPIIAFDPTSRGAIAYRELAKEVSGGSPKRAR